MSQPTFNKDGIWNTKAFRGRNVELRKKTWEQHIIKDSSRGYLKTNFDKIIATLEKPDNILQSPKEKGMVAYTRKFEDICIWNTTTVKAYLYVLVNHNNNNIRTIYTNPKLKRWTKLWPKK